MLISVEEAKEQLRLAKEQERRNKDAVRLKKIAEERAELNRKRKQFVDEQNALLAPLVGAGVVSANYDDVGEGTVTIKFDNGLDLSCTASGDDMTFLSWSVEKTSA